MTTWRFSLVLLLPLCLQAAGFWRSAIDIASNPYQLDYGEGIVLYQASKITDRAVAYKPISSYPFVVFHYPPAYHWCVLALSKITGSLLQSGRAVSVISGALTTVTIGVLIYLSLPTRDFRRRLTTALFGGLLPCLLVVMMWTSLARVDMLAAFLSCLGLAVFVTAGRTSPLQYLAFGCFVGAAFTKQTAIAAPVACVVTAFVIDPRQARRLVAFATALGGLTLLILSWWTRGGVLRHLFLYNQNTFSLERALQGLAENVVLTLPIVALAGAFLAFVVFDVRSVPRDRRWRRLRVRLGHSRLRRLGFVATMTVAVALLVALTYGKTGSNFNYFIEWNLVCCVLAALALFRGWNLRWFTSLVLLVAYGFPVAIAVAGLPSGLRAFGDSSPAVRAHGSTQRHAHATLVELARHARGPILSENMLALLEAGKDVPAEPAILRELATSQVWDETLLTTLIAERKFELIIAVDLSNRVMFTEAVAKAIEDSYTQTRQVGQYEVYAPREQK